MAAIFISYFREDARDVQVAVDLLGSANIECWMDTKRLEPGYNWSEQVKSVIESASAFVYFHSHHYNEKTQSYVRQELEIACDVLRKLHPKALWFFPVLLDSSAFPSIQVGPERRLSDYQFTDYSTRSPGAIALLAERIRQFLDDREFNSGHVTIFTSKLSIRPDFHIDGNKWGLLPKTGSTKIPLAAGRHSFKCFDFVYSGGRYTGGYVPVTSNTIEVDIGPRQNVVLYIRKAKRSGFLWRKWEQDQNFIIERA